MSAVDGIDIAGATSNQGDGMPFQHSNEARSRQLWRCPEKRHHVTVECTLELVVLVATFSTLFPMQHIPFNSNSHTMIAFCLSIDTEVFDLHVRHVTRGQVM
jgi:hypothetical protein